MCSTLANPSTRRPPTRWVGESMRDEIRIVGFELLELVQEGVELGVGDLRGAVDVVLLLVVANQRAEFLDAVEGGCHESFGRSVRLQPDFRSA